MAPSSLSSSRAWIAVLSGYPLPRDHRHLQERGPEQTHLVDHEEGRLALRVSGGDCLGDADLSHARQQTSSGPGPSGDPREEQFGDAQRDDHARVAHAAQADVRAPFAEDDLVFPGSHDPRWNDVGRVARTRLLLASTPERHWSQRGKGLKSASSHGSSGKPKARRQRPLSQAGRGVGGEGRFSPPTRVPSRTG